MTGDISVIPKAGKRPVQPSDLGLTPPYNGLPAVLVADGRVVETTLCSLGKDCAWLMDLLQAHGIDPETLARVFLATLDGEDRLHVDLFSSDGRPSAKN